MVPQELIQRGAHSQQVHISGRLLAQRAFWEPFLEKVPNEKGESIWSYETPSPLDSVELIFKERVSPQELRALTLEVTGVLPVLFDHVGRLSNPILFLFVC